MCVELVVEAVGACDGNKALAFVVSCYGTSSEASVKNIKKRTGRTKVFSLLAASSPPLETACFVISWRLLWFLWSC